MLPAFCDAQAPVPPPAYHRAQVGGRPALHIDALTLVRRLHLLTLCRLAVCYALWRCPPPLPAGPGGGPPRHAGGSFLPVDPPRARWPLSLPDVPQCVVAVLRPFPARGAPRAAHPL